ncbi:hypothetical protein F5887DRAFT_1283258 [Amanita rubescens]|nr:hypothetical protein F5887DRAFT_1283258 [Amanita rubescens]
MLAWKMLQVAQGLEYIHSEGVVHGDIRGANILLDDNLRLWINSRLGSYKFCSIGNPTNQLSSPPSYSESWRTMTPSMMLPLERKCRTSMRLDAFIMKSFMPFADKLDIQIFALVARWCASAST